ncbi:hypothetical protein CALVIDRAFT_166305 [Calocera viscosa TUFC12733]|uniref:ARM repeat-containing protein n=1 Tax=Calocera viscosa (strain TUFC12733) TaxID=1330018 RepID=A0A167LH12_CALVF|nr:hypothetical protein CALVIDRAFT_166305 [Calocera viscosa TUFC12733]
MSYYRGPPQPQRGRYDYSNGSHPNANPYQQPGQWRDDRNYYAGGRPQQPYVQPQQQPRPPPQQQPRPQPQRYSRPSPPPKTPRTEAREILDDVRSSKEQRARAFKVLLDDARATPHSTRSVSSLTSAFHLFASDQQEEVIDFVYDLCEDPEQGVRIQGYRTIVELSKAVPSWTRRNADVLVQLLQSDSQTELRVIRDALVSHIRTDPVAAIEVITEHMARAGEVEDKSAQPLTGGMKRLVLDFLMTADVAKARGEKLVAASDAEASFNQGVSEALLYSTRSDAKELLSLIQTLPSWTSQSQPNQFRTQSISSLLERVITLTHKLEAAAAEDALALFILAQDAAAGGNGDPRAFLRFWARMAWSDWTVAEQYEYGRAESILRWLKASMLVWKDVHREQKDDVAAFEESSLTRDVSAAVTVLFLSAAGTFEKAGAANQEKMWAFVDTTLAIFSRLCQTVNRFHTFPFYAHAHQISEDGFVCTSRYILVRTSPQNASFRVRDEGCPWIWIEPRQHAPAEFHCLQM